MGIDYFALWALTIANTFAILVVVRMLARLPRTQAPGPRPGAAFVNWTLTTAAGHARTSQEMPVEYTVLFTAETCRPCHALLAELARTRPELGTLVLATEGDPAAFALSANGSADVLFHELLTGADQAFRNQFRIPGTPFAVAIRGGHVQASGIAPTTTELAQIAGVLRGTHR